MTKYEIDHQDAKSMWEFQMSTLKIADQYAEARREFSKALKILKIGLAGCYKANTIERKHAEDKAYLIMAERDEKYRQALSDLIENEGEYKGLEKVLEARQGALSFNQSLIKNQARQT